jgi:hypothetical protein
MERTMKLQDVILKAMAKKISWLEAAAIAGVCDRTMRRMPDAYREGGIRGHMHRLNPPERVNPRPFTPAEEVIRGPRISRPRVPVADVDGEELNETQRTLVFHLVIGERFCLQRLAAHRISSLHNPGSRLLSELPNPKGSIFCQLKVHQARLQLP